MLQSHLSGVADPRRPQGQRYELQFVLLYSILAILSGAGSYRKIQGFIATHRERLNGVFGTSWKRAPAYTSIRDILRALDSKNIEKAFRGHVRSLLREASGPARSGLVIAVDGKTLRGSFDGFEDRNAAHMLFAFSHDERIILGHLEVDEKSNEIPAARKMIKELGLSERVYTMDAMHCQKNFRRSRRGGMRSDIAGEGESA